VEDVSTERALGEGYLDTASFGFRDEAKGLSEASSLPGWLGAARVGYEYLRGEPGKATKTYEQARDEPRQLQRAAQEQHRAAYLGGEVAGGVAGVLALPVHGAAEGAGALDANADVPWMPTMPASAQLPRPLRAIMRNHPTGDVLERVNAPR
jgi:hypothetical protein